VAKPLTTHDAIEAKLLRPLTSNELRYMDELMDQASSLLRTAMPTVDARMAAWTDQPRPRNAVDPLVVTSVLASVIKRYLANPLGAASSSDAQGPFSHTTTFASYGKNVGGTGELTVTTDDLAQIAPPRAAGPRTARLGSPFAAAGYVPTR
jgi:hypothetical protein